MGAGGGWEVSRRDASSTYSEVTQFHRCDEIISHTQGWLLLNGTLEGHLFWGESDFVKTAAMKTGIPG